MWTTGPGIEALSKDSLSRQEALTHSISEIGFQLSVLKRLVGRVLIARPYLSITEAGKLACTIGPTHAVL